MSMHRQILHPDPALNPSNPIPNHATPILQVTAKYDCKHEPHHALPVPWSVVEHDPRVPITLYAQHVALGLDVAEIESNTTATRLRWMTMKASEAIEGKKATVSVGDGEPIPFGFGWNVETQSMALETVAIQTMAGTRWVSFAGRFACPTDSRILDTLA